MTGGYAAELHAGFVVVGQRQFAKVVRNHIIGRRDGGGKDCIFTPKMIGHDVQITLALESKNRAGKIKDLSVTQVIARSGKPFEVALGDFQFTFTPKIISE